MRSIEGIFALPRGSSPTLLNSRMDSPVCTTLALHSPSITASRLSDMNPDVRSFHHPDTSTWSHIVVDPATRRGAIIDPVLDFDPASGRVQAGSAQRLLEYIATTGLGIDWILETHIHADHLTAAAWLKDRLGTNAASPKIGIGRGVIQVQRTFKQKLSLDDGFAADGREFDVLFDDGSEIKLGSITGRVLTTPGHTPDGLSYVFGNAVFIGDTLFAPRGGTARCDFPGGDAQVLFDSIQRLYALPDATRVFLAHDYPPQGEAPIAETSIGAQKVGNIQVRVDTSAEEFVAMRKYRDATLGMPRLLWPSLQVNIRAGRLPPAESNGQRYLRVPLSADGFVS